MFLATSPADSARHLRVMLGFLLLQEEGSRRENYAPPPWDPSAQNDALCYDGWRHGDPLGLHQPAKPLIPVERTCEEESAQCDSPSLAESAGPAATQALQAASALGPRETDKLWE